MLKLRAVVVMVVLVTLALVGSAVAYADHEVGWGWWWNASVEIEDVDLRPHWTVLGEDGQTIDDEADSYFARIKIKVPKDADAEVEEEAATERVSLRGSKKLKCKSDGIEVEVTYKVSAVERVAGTTVAVEITADGQYVSSATGHLGENIKLQVLVPSDHPDCAE